RTRSSWRRTACSFSRRFNSSWTKAPTKPISVHLPEVNLMSELLTKKENGIGTITLNRPAKKNSFTFEMIEEWAATLQKWRTDPEVAVIVLTGAGGDFSSGVDFSSAGDPMQAGPYEM